MFCVLCSVICLLCVRVLMLCGLLSLLCCVLCVSSAVSWIRKYLKQHPVKLVRSVEENTRRVKSVLEDACEHINTYYEVDDLCHSLPDRLKALVEKEGERLKH